MVKVGEISVEITATTSKLRANLAQASSLIRDFSLLSQGLTGGIGEAFRQISEVAIRGLQISLFGLIGTFTLAAKTGADFEDEMVRAFTILKEGGNAVADSMSRMTSTALNLGRETLFSAVDAAQGMQILARAGFDTKEMLNSIRPSLDLAIVGNMELAESANIVISALRGFNMETRDAGKVADILALGSSKANTTVQELGNAFSYVAPVANGAGMSIETTVAAIGMLANAGIKGSKAGTTLRRAISQLLAPSGRAKKIMNELGVSFVNSSGKLKPFVTIIRDLQASSMNASQAMQLFGLRAGPGMIALVNAGANSISELSYELENAEGTADSMSQAFRTTVKGRVRDLMASVIDLGLAFSEKFKRPLADSIFAVRNFIVSIVNTGNRMGVFRSVVIGVGKALEPITDLIEKLAIGFKKWVAALTPRKISKFFSDLREDVEAFVTSLTEGEIGAILKDTFEVVIGLGKMLIGIIKGISKAWMTLPEGVRNFLRPMILVTLLILKLAGGLMNIIFLFVSLGALASSLGLSITAWGIVIIGIKAALIALAVVVAAIGVGIGVWKLVEFLNDAEAVEKVFNGLKEDVKLVGELFSSIGETFEDIVDVVYEYFVFVLDLVESIAKSIREWDFSNVVPSLKGINDAVDSLKDSFNTLIGKVKEFGDEILIVLNKVPLLHHIIPDVAKSAGGTTVTGGGTIPSGNAEIAAMLARDELTALKNMTSQTANIGGIIGESARLSNLIGLQEKLNELEKVVMEQEGNIDALNRQVIKPEADRQNKSRIGASLDG